MRPVEQLSNLSRGLAARYPFCPGSARKVRKSPRHIRAGAGWHLRRQRRERLRVSGREFEGSDPGTYLALKGQVRETKAAFPGSQARQPRWAFELSAGPVRGDYFCQTRSGPPLIHLDALSAPFSEYRTMRRLFGAATAYTAPARPNAHRIIRGNSRCHISSSWPAGLSLITTSAFASRNAAAHRAAFSRKKGSCVPATRYVRGNRPGIASGGR
jgi:hypothetical protein